MTSRKRETAGFGGGASAVPAASGGAGGGGLAKLGADAHHGDEALLLPAAGAGKGGGGGGGGENAGAANGVSFLQAYERQALRLPPWAMRLIRRWRARLCPRMRFGNATFRFTMLFLTVVVVFSGYFSYDLPGITSEDLKAVMALTNTQLGVLFSVYAFPNAFLPLLSGAYYNAFGIWRGVLAIAVCIAAGITVVSLGAYAQSYWLMVAGRVLYGLGGESVYVGVDVLATDWFKDEELGLAYGLIQSAGQAGSFAAFYGVPWLSHATHGFISSYWAAVALAVLSVASLYAAHGLEQTMILPGEGAGGGGGGADAGAGAEPRKRLGGGGAAART